MPFCSPRLCSPAVDPDCPPGSDLSSIGPSQPASQIYCPISPFSVPPDQPTSCVTCHLVTYLTNVPHLYNNRMPIRVASPAPVPSQSSSPLPAMCAVNPSRVGKTFDNAALCEIINTISNGRDCLLEIVNFNIEVRYQFFTSLHSY
jgi:hypothetical protein